MKIFIITLIIIIIITIIIIIIYLQPNNKELSTSSTIKVPTTTNATTTNATTKNATTKNATTTNATTKNATTTNATTKNATTTNATTTNATTTNAPTTTMSQGDLLKSIIIGCGQNFCPSAPSANECEDSIFNYTYDLLTPNNFETNCSKRCFCSILNKYKKTTGVLDVQNANGQCGTNFSRNDCSL